MLLFAGHAIMTSFMRQLRSLARTYSLSILVRGKTFTRAYSHLNLLKVLNGTSASAPHNPQSAFLTTTRKPALGPTFTFMTDATLWLAKRHQHPGGTGGLAAQESGDNYVAELFRSRTMVCVYLPSFWESS